MSIKVKLLIIADITGNNARFYVIRTNQDSILTINNCITVNGDLISICDEYEDAEKIIKKLTGEK